MSGASPPPSPPPHAATVEVRVVLPDSDVFTGTIRHVTARRVEIGLSGERLPEFSGPQLVTLVFRARGGGKLAAAARWVKREIDASGTAGLVCLLVDPTSEPLPPELPDGHGRRRGAYRVQPAAPQDVPVTICPFLDPRRSWARQLADLRTRGPRDVVHGSLADISLGGAGVHVGKDDRWPYTYAQLVLLSIDFARRVAPLHVPASILRRIEAPTGILYGVAFTPLTSCPFAPVERELLEYVMGRQRQDLRYRAG